MPPPRSLQDLPPKAAHFCLAVERFIQEELQANLSGARVLVAFSGGLDSTALLLSMRYLADRLDLDLLAAHLDHGLRPESAAEAEACAAFCEEHGVSLYRHRLELDPTSKGLEERARSARYTFLEEAREEIGASWILTAHQADDLVEDVLLRLVRGTGWPELGGMPGRDEKRRLLRPLLASPRRDLQAFLEQIDANWFEDSSNVSLEHRRNRFRHQVVPLLEKENPNLSEAVHRLWSLARWDEEFWREMGESAVPANNRDGSILLAAEELAAAPRALRLRRFKAVLEALGPGQPLMRNLLNLDQAFLERRTGSTIQFPGGKIAEVTRHGVRFSRTPDSATYND